jgi:SAM-dependent methyltransferase
VTLGDVPAGLYGSGAYRPEAPRLHGAAQPVLRLFDTQRLALVRSIVPAPARLLDAGAGRGRFVAAARVAGYDAFGVEPSGSAVEPSGAAAGGAAGAREAAADTPGPDRSILRTTIEGARIDAGSVDVVTLWHVLEHLDRPGPALERIGSWLRPGGGVVIGVPNLASLQARLGGDRWFHLDVPRHRVHFTPAGLDALLRSHGFTTHSVRHTLLEHNPFGMWQTLLSRLTRHPSYVYNLLKRNAPLRSTDLAIAVAALPALPVAAALELAAGAAGRGGTIAVVARRGD